MLGAAAAVVFVLALGVPPASASTVSPLPAPGWRAVPLPDLGGALNDLSALGPSSGRACP
jgi:hypothetical protein